MDTLLLARRRMSHFRLPAAPSSSSRSTGACSLAAEVANLLPLFFFLFNRISSAIIMDMASFRKAILQQVLQPPVHQSLCSLMCFCNPPLLAGPSCWKLIQARSASLELMFRCRLAFVGRQWPKTFIDLTVAIPGSNLHPAACHHHGPRCYPANHVLEAVPGARAVVALVPTAIHSHAPACLAAVVGILDALPPARLAALSRLPSPWVP